MKISIQITPEQEDTELIVSCKRLTPEIERMIATLRMMDNQLTVRSDDTIHILDVCEILYIEAVDRKTFVYTKDQVFESDFRLYELEGELSDGYFFRINKSCIVNLRKIKTLKADLERRIRITMDNEEQLVASRMYADELRKRLGVK